MELLRRYGWLLPVVTVVASFLVFMGLWGGDALLFVVRAMTVVVVLTLGAQVVVAFLFLRDRDCKCSRYPLQPSVFGPCSNGIFRKDTDKMRIIENTDFFDRASDL